jgi:zinc transport system substrate-binding protein
MRTGKIMSRAVGKIAVFFIALLAFSGIGSAAEKIPVFVSVAPQKLFVQKIGREWVSVQVMVQVGANPATYEPKPKQMTDLSKTKAYFAIGVPFEDIWLDRISAANPEMKVVHTDRDVAKLPMAAHYHHDSDDAYGATGEHHEHGDHSKADANPHGLDPHIWLSPPLVKIQIRSILSTLKAIDPLHQDAYEVNYRRFVAEIDQLDGRLRKTFEGHLGLRKEGIKVVFVQPQFSTKSARLVAKEIGGQVAFADPLAEDWAVNLQAVADRFNAALK